jgi:hypothetical protein
MSKEFIPHQEALDLKHLGFDEAISTYYSFPDIELSYVMDGHSKVSVRRNSQFGHAVSAPTYSQAFRWFRKSENGSLNHLDFMYEYLKDDSMSYEDAELACLKKLIQIVKNKGGDK